MRCTAVALMLLLLPATARADDICQNLQSNLERLRCYDQAAGREAPEVVVLERWRGEGDQFTEPFELDGPWVLGWAALGGRDGWAHFQASLHAEDGTYIDTIGSSDWYGTGQSYYPTGGRFTLRFRAKGGWRAWIREP